MQMVFIWRSWLPERSGKVRMVRITIILRDGSMRWTL